MTLRKVDRTDVPIEDLEINVPSEVERKYSFSDVRDFIITKSEYPKVPFPEEFDYPREKLNPDKYVIPIKPHGNNIVIRLCVKDSFITIRANKVNFANVIDARVVAIGDNVVNVKIGDKVALHRTYPDHMNANHFTYIDGSKRDIMSVKEMLDTLSPDESQQLIKEGIDSTEVISYLIVNSVIDVAYTVLE